MQTLAAFQTGDVQSVGLCRGLTWGRPAGRHLCAPVHMQWRCTQTRARWGCRLCSAARESMLTKLWLPFLAAYFGSVHYNWVISPPALRVMLLIKRDFLLTAGSPVLFRGVVSRRKVASCTPGSTHFPNSFLANLRTSVIQAKSCYRCRSLL